MRRSSQWSFNPLPSHEGRLCRKALFGGNESFNPLPSHEGRRVFDNFKAHGILAFQSTSLSRGKTLGMMDEERTAVFQSTSLSRGKTSPPRNAQRSSLTFNPLPSHEGRLPQDGFAFPVSIPFNPLPSHEGRRITGRTTEIWNVFQSTSLSRGKTR